jgi:hypothetical protein
MFNMKDAPTPPPPSLMQQAYDELPPLRVFKVRRVQPDADFAIEEIILEAHEVGETTSGSLLFFILVPIDIMHEGKPNVGIVKRTKRGFAHQGWEDYEEVFENPSLLVH